MSRVRDLRALPKTHLHLHLEGAIRPATLVQLAAECGVEAPSGRFVDLAGFFIDYQRVRACVGSEAAFRRIAFELCEDEAAQGVRYAEVTFSPAFHALREFPPEPYSRVFEAAVDGGLHSVPHAGEDAGPSSIRGALQALRAERLGHGVRILEDPELVAEVRERRIPLEVCPSINVATGVFPSLAEHPLPKLLSKGLVVTLNADVPRMIPTSVTREYELARDTFGLHDESLAQIARNGVFAAFLTRTEQAELNREIDAWLLRPAEVKVASR